MSSGGFVGDPASRPGDRPGNGLGDGSGQGSGPGDGPSGPAADGAGALPGVRPIDAASEPSPDVTVADAAPPVDPGFVDDYSRLWRAVEKGKRQVAVLSQQAQNARSTLAASWSDFTTVLRERGRAEHALTDATSQLEYAVRDAYITGSTDVDMVLNVLGSQPDDVLRNIDALVYVRAATGSESVDVNVARSHAMVVESAVEAARERMSADARRVASVRKELARAKAKLKQDQEELQALIAAAAPQTVVGRNGCPSAVLDGTVPEGVNIKKLCGLAVATAATPQAAVAIKWALVRLGAPYACGGIGRLEAWRYDCSSYVSRAYAEGAGLRTAGDGWAPSTRNMVPWDGVPLDPHYAPIDPEQLRPGDLVLYDTCPPGDTCPYRHVVMYLGPAEKGGVPLMAHTNSCGSVAHVASFPGTAVDNFLGVRRVVALEGERITVSFEAPARPGAPGDSGKPAKSRD